MDGFVDISIPYEVIDRQDADRLASSIRVPRRVEMRRGNLIFDYGKEPEEVIPSRRDLRRKMFFPFLKLADAADSKILGYAETWGRLGICRHGLPYSHHIQTNPQNLFDETPCPHIHKRGRCFVEPLERWRHYSRKMQAILSLATALRQTEPEVEGIIYWSDFLSSSLPEPFGDPSAWEIAYQDFPKPRRRDLDKVLGGRRELSRILNYWIRVAYVAPQLTWELGVPKVSLESFYLGNTLFPRLVIQLLLESSDTWGLALCAGCRVMFPVRQGQSPDGKSFCVECGQRGEPQRQASKRYRERQRKDSGRRKRQALTEDQAREIRHTLRAPDPPSVRQLAEKYGVSASTIYKIREGKNWSRLQQEG